MDLIHGQGSVVNAIIKAAEPRAVQFTGSSRVGELLAADTRGKVKLEDAGFDWKILGPDVAEMDYVAWQCDQARRGGAAQPLSYHFYFMLYILS